MQGAHCASWARGIERKFATLGMASPFIFSGIGALDNHGFVAKMAEVQQRTCDCLRRPLGQVLLKGSSCALFIIGLAAQERFFVS